MASPRRRARRMYSSTFRVLAEDPREVDEARARVREAPGLVQVLHVVLPHPLAQPVQEVDGIPGAPRHPEQVQLEVDVAGIGLLDEDVVPRHPRVVGEREELPVVVVIAQPQSHVPRHPTGRVEVLRERRPGSGVANHHSGREVDAEDRVDDVVGPEDPRVLERGAPRRGVERLRDRDVSGADPDVVGVGDCLELLDGRLTNPAAPRAGSRWRPARPWCLRSRRPAGCAACRAGC